jgi:hypothetical protein
MADIPIDRFALTGTLVDTDDADDTNYTDDSDDTQ